MFHTWRLDSCCSLTYAIKRPFHEQRWVQGTPERPLLSFYGYIISHNFYLRRRTDDLWCLCIEAILRDEGQSILWPRKSMKIQLRVTWHDLKGSLLKPAVLNPSMHHIFTPNSSTTFAFSLVSFWSLHICFFQYNLPCSLQTKITMCVTQLLNVTVTVND